MPTRNAFTGVWTYRSWINNPEPVEADGDSKETCRRLSELLFAEAELVLEDGEPGIVRGRLNMGKIGSLTISGSAGYGNPFSIRFQGVGMDSDSPSKGWIYDYVGWLVPLWPAGVDQRRAIVGSVVRTVQHGQAKPGKVASFVAVKHDS
jgi:hypothetical protein